MSARENQVSGLGELSPWAAHFCLGIEAFLKEQIPIPLAGQSVLAAFSGGLDSTALLHILRLLAPRLGFTLHAAHLDHGLRPESAAQAQTVVQLCQDLGLACAVRAVDVAALSRQGGQGLEETGRRVRYAFLEEVRSETGAATVVTAHQLDELAEDVLMRLLRGTGWPGLGGMLAWDPRRRLLRPLLLTPKEDLRRFLGELGQGWLEDSSNTDRAFLRNRVRLDLLPLFKRENPQFVQVTAELWRQARIDASFFEDMTAKSIAPTQEPGREHFLGNEALLALPQALRLRLYKRTVENLGPGQPLAQTLRGLDLAWSAKRVGSVFQFPGGKEAKVERLGISFKPGAAADQTLTRNT